MQVHKHHFDKHNSVKQWKEYSLSQEVSIKRGEAHGITSWYIQIDRII